MDDDLRVQIMGILSLAGHEITLATNRLGFAVDRLIVSNEVEICRQVQLLKSETDASILGIGNVIKMLEQNQ